MPCLNLDETLFPRAARKCGFTQICLVQIWCKNSANEEEIKAKVVLEITHIPGVVNFVLDLNYFFFGFILFALSKFGENQIFRAVVVSQSNPVFP